MTVVRTKWQGTQVAVLSPKPALERVFRVLRTLMSPIWLILGFIVMVGLLAWLLFKYT